MNTTERAFQNRVDAVLAQIDPAILDYNESEFWMMRRAYEYIEYYAFKNMFFNTMIALPLCRGMHNGTYRKKSTMTKDGVPWKLPYVFHCLAVCQMLVDLHLPLCPEEEDCLLASALCHDMIEDIPFENGGRELMTQFGLSEMVYNTVKTLSKRDDFTQEEHEAYFHGIEQNKLALLIKLSDRGHNVEDLYNMSIWKVHEYVGETNDYFFPMCLYARTHYPELRTSFEILEEKIVTLTSVSEILVSRYEKMEQTMLEQIREACEENECLRNWLSNYQTQMAQNETERRS